jgi:hypothetical protein
MAFIASGVTARAGYNRRIPGYDYSTKKTDKVVLSKPKPVASVETVQNQAEKPKAVEIERVKRPLLYLNNYK